VKKLRLSLAEAAQTSRFYQNQYASLHCSANLRVVVCLSSRCFRQAADDSNFFVLAFRSTLLPALFHPLCLRPHSLSTSSYLSRPSCRAGLSSTPQLRCQICGALVVSNNQRDRTSFFSASDNPDLTLLPGPSDRQPPAWESNSPPPVQPRRSTRVSRAVVERHLNQTYQTSIQPPSQSSCLQTSFQQADILANPGGLSRSTCRSTTRAVPSTSISAMANAARSSADSLRIPCKKLDPTCCSSLDLRVTDYDPDADTIQAADKAQSDTQDESSQRPQDSAPQTQPEVGAPLPSSQSLTGVAPSTGVPNTTASVYWTPRSSQPCGCAYCPFWYPEPLCWLHTLYRGFFRCGRSLLHPILRAFWRT